MPVTSELQAIPFGSLIGGPLDAAIEAQARAAMSSVNFIKSVGFDESGKVNTVSFVVRKGDAETTIQVPLLTIVPVPFIRIDDMTIDFKANISSTRETEDKTKESRQGGVKVQASARYLIAKASLEASFSSKKDSESTKNSRYSVETTMDVHVHAVQDALPGGLAKMLNILAETIEAPTSAEPPAGQNSQTDKTGGKAGDKG